MSLETQISNLVSAVNKLTEALEKKNNENIASPAVGVSNPGPAVSPVVADVPAPAPQAPIAPPVQVAPVPVAVVVPTAPVVAMPAPPAFVAPAAPAAPAGAPFSDPKGLIDYVMTTYKALGATKGAGIQGVLVSLGYQNINDVKPEHYAALYAGIEGLK